MKTRIAMLTVGIFGLFAASLCVPAIAAGPELVISWKATDSAAPAAYVGKALPTANSTITASVAVLSGESFVNLSGRTIYWYLDDGLIGGGVGKTSVTFKAAGHNEIMSLNVRMPDYPSGQLINVVHIPVVDPKVVIVAPYAGKSFSGSSVAVHADPYFWDAASLQTASFAWSVNGQAVTSADNPQDLSINLGGSLSGGFPVTINLLMQKNGDPLTNAISSITLITQ